MSFGYQIYLCMFPPQFEEIFSMILVLGSTYLSTLKQYVTGD